MVNKECCFLIKILKLKFGVGLVMIIYLCIKFFEKRISVFLIVWGNCDLNKILWKKGKLNEMLVVD